MNTEILIHDPARAAEILCAGGLVAVPTETVYGLASNGLDAHAVQRIYDVKGRPAVKPLSLMVHDASWMKRLCAAVPRVAEALAGRFWPGPLTIILPAKDLIPEIVRAGGDTIGLRCPDHPDTLALIRQADLPLAAPSANPSGAPSPKTAGEVAAYFSGSIEAIIDGGACGIGLESTIVDLAHTPYRILRQGALPAAEVWQCVQECVTVIGITGGTGCGKTTLLQVLEKRGALLLDADAIYHELLETDEELLSAINNRFPGTVVNGALQRKVLGAQVFSDPDALNALNAITHRAILAEIEAAKKSISDSETREIELMDEQEAAEKLLAKAERSYKATRRTVQAEVRELDSLKEAIAKEIAEKEKRSAELAKNVIPNYLEPYRRMLAAGEGSPVGTIRNGSCSNCNMKNSPQTTMEARNGNLVNCDNCSFYLYDPEA